MSFWPTDTAGEIADVLAVITAAGAAWSGIVAKVRGSAADKSAKAADQAVREMRKEFARRDLLPDAAKRYQSLYRELAPFLSGSGEPHEATQKIGELRGVIVTLEAYLDEDEKATLTLVKARLESMKKDPTNPSHTNGLLGDAAALSVELEGIVKRVTWNSQS